GRLPGAFGSGSCIGHGRKICEREGRGGRAPCQPNAQLRTAAEVRLLLQRLLHRPCWLFRAFFGGGLFGWSIRRDRGNCGRLNLWFRRRLRFGFRLRLFEREDRAARCFWNLRQFFVNDFDDRAEWKLRVKLGHVARFHPDAAVARRATDRFLFRRTVNINTAAEGVRIFGLKTFQPNDPRDDRIAARRIRLENFTREPAVAKDGADRRVIANLFRDLKKPERRRHVAPGIADAELGSGNRIRGQTRAVAHQHELLVFYADDYAAGTIRAKGGSEADER